MLLISMYSWFYIIYYFKAFNLYFRVNLGHYHVDFESPERTRTPKQSADYYRKVVTTGCLVDSCEPTTKKIQL